jgi:hypothetical protein
LTAKQTATYQVHGTNGACTIPAGATAISGNATITDPTDDGFMTIAPAGGIPEASNLNWLRGQSPTPNAFTVALSAGGAIDVYNDRGTVNVIIDINGYYEDHNHDDRYYTEAESDAKYVPQGDIMFNHGTSQLTPNGGVPPSDFTAFASGNVVSGDGLVNFSPTGPATLGSVSYGLKSVTFCIEGISGGAFVTTVSVFTETPFTQVVDTTDRTTAGCFTVQVNRTGARAYDVMFSLSGGGSLRFVGIQTTWAPSSTLTPVAAFDEEPAVGDPGTGR